MAPDTLVPLNEARKKLIPRRNGKTLNGGTLRRWVHDGLAGENDERIRLEVVYIGRTPHVSAQMIDNFFRAITAARLSLAKKTRCDVTEDDLRAANLLGCRRRTPKKLVADTDPATSHRSPKS